MSQLIAMLPEHLRETLLYYERHWEDAALEAVRDQDRSGLKVLAERLQPGALVLDAGCGPGLDIAWLNGNGFQAEGFDACEKLIDRALSLGVKAIRQEMLFATLPREHYDAIWCSRSLVHLTLEESQRVLALFFQSLKPATGLLFLSYLEGEGSFSDPESGDGARRTFYRFSDKGLQSLLRQSGFTPLLQGERKDPTHPDRKWMAVLCKRA